MEVFMDMIFICLGLVIWQAGLLTTVLGIALIKTQTEDILKLAGMTSLAIDMKYIRKIKSIVEPVDRSTKLGVLMFAGGAGLMLTGVAIINGFI